MVEEASITINGQPRPYQPQTLVELLAASGIDPAQPGVAIALNARVVSRASWDSQQLAPGDQVEIVHARAGG